MEKCEAESGESGLMKARITSPETQITASGSTRLPMCTSLEIVGFRFMSGNITNISYRIKPIVFQFESPSSGRLKEERIIQGSKYSIWETSLVATSSGEPYAAPTNAEHT